MARTLIEAQLTTRNARSKLAVGLHWRGLDREVHLGYRKGQRGGVWLVRWRDGDRYKQERLGVADDVLAEGSLDFEAAAKAGRAVVTRKRKYAAASLAGPALTVSSAVEHYVAERDARDTRRAGRTVKSDARGRLSKHIVGRSATGTREAIAAAPIAELALHQLSETDLAAWLAGLPGNLKRTARQRLVNDFKAALNLAYTTNRKKLDPELPSIIKNGLTLETTESDGVEDLARENQILSDVDVGRIITAAHDVDDAEDWGGDLFRMVVLLAATGARFSQIARMRVGDCQIGASRLLIPPSRKGKGSKSGVIVVPIGTDVVEALAPVMTGRSADEPLLQRWRHKQARGGIFWERDKRGPWLSSSEMVRPWNDVRERARLPAVIPYALRHSSIVRSIRANLPLRYVAAQHDTSTAMIERHYAKWITTGLEEMARAAIVPLVPSEGSKAGRAH